MYLVKRWDNVILDRSLVFDTAKTQAIVASATFHAGQRIDVVDHWDDRPDQTVAMYMNGHEV